MFAMEQHARVFWQSAQLIRLDLVLLVLGVVTGSVAMRVSPRAFDELLFAEEVGAFERRQQQVIRERELFVCRR